MASEVSVEIVQTADVQVPCALRVCWHTYNFVVAGAFLKPFGDLSCKSSKSLLPEGLQGTRRPSTLPARVMHRPNFLHDDRLQYAVFTACASVWSLGPKNDDKLNPAINLAPLPKGCFANH